MAGGDHIPRVLNSRVHYQACMQLQAKGGSFSPKGGFYFQLNGCGLHMNHINSCVHYQACMQLQAKGGSFSPKGGFYFQLNGCGLHMNHINSCVSKGGFY